MDCALLAAVDSPAPRPMLPARVKALCVAREAGLCAWLVEALSVDSAAQVALVESRSAAEALERIRDEAFDAVLIAHRRPALDAFDLLDAMRAAGCEEPVLVLGDEADPELLALALESGAEAYVALRSTTTRALIWTLARAVERGELARENRRLRQADRQRLEQEHLETQRLIDEQRLLIRELEQLDDAALDEGPGDVPARECEPGPPLPEALTEHYHHLLRTYVIMGSGNLGGDIRALARLLAEAGLGARRAMQLHLQVVEWMLRGLGNRSTRHIMSRADLLALELVVELAEAFRMRLEEHLRPARQLWLPNFLA